MNAVRGLLRDLVERKLWPVAVLLLVAARRRSRLPRPHVHRRRRRPAAASRPQADAGKTSKAAVSIEDAAADDERPGGVRNPFKQLHVPKRPSTRARAKPAARPPTRRSSSGGSGATARSRRSDPGGSGGSGGSGDAQAQAAAGDPLDVYHLSLRFGRAEATQLKTYHDVARLSPLPTADNPFFVYTGVLKDGKTAVFLLSSDATATGDGHCRPSAKSCQTIEVKEGDTEFFDLTVNGEPVQYQLDVVQGVQEGRQLRGRRGGRLRAPSNAGADMLRRAHRIGSSAFKGAATYRWLPESGVLVRTPKHGKARASVNGAAAASPADATGALPGLPVWALAARRRLASREPSIHFGARWR